MRWEVVLIGPVRSGKSTQGRLLAEALGRPQVSLDEERWRYYREIGYDDELAAEIRRRGGFLALVMYWGQFDAYAVERLLVEHHGCVFDFGAAIYESRENLDRVRRALSNYPNVFLLLPSADKEESLRILRERDEDPPADLNFDFNRRFLDHPSYDELARHTIYTAGRTPEQTRDEILRLLEK
jgi:adenylate kinase family enzyme